MNETLIAIFSFKLTVKYQSKTFLYMCDWNSILAFHLPCIPHKFFPPYSASASTLQYSLAPSHHWPGLPCLTHQMAYLAPVSQHLSCPSLGYPADFSNLYHLGNHPSPIPACPCPLLWTTFALVKVSDACSYICELGKSWTFLITSFLKYNAQDKTISCGHCNSSSHLGNCFFLQHKAVMSPSDHFHIYICCASVLASPSPDVLQEHMLRYFLTGVSFHYWNSAGCSSRCKPIAGIKPTWLRQGPDI